MSTVAEIEKLLAEVKGIIEKHKKVDEMTGKNFNIFKVCEIHDKEVLLCRFIYQLINPNGLHNQGDFFLRKFITDVLGGTICNDNNYIDEKDFIITEDELSKVQVTKEYVIKNNRRIDLLIETNKHSIPIEVKIYAGDQKDQCNDYLEYSKNSKLYYLTLYGDPPSDISYKYESKISDKDSYEDKQNKKIEEIKDKISCISFRDDIILCIEKCIKEVEILDKALIRENLLQFYNNLKELCNMSNDNINNDLIKILENKDNFAAYFEMKKSVPKIQSSVLIKIIEKLNIWAKQNNYDIDDVYSDYMERAGILSRGGNVGNRVPGFGVICENTQFGCNLKVCLEANKNDGLYYGVWVDDVENREEKLRDIKEYLEKNGIFGDGYDAVGWAMWDHVKVNGNNIFFSEPSDGFVELLGKYKCEGFEWKNFVEDVEKRLADLINKLNKK